MKATTEKPKSLSDLLACRRGQPLVQSLRERAASGDAFAAAVLSDVGIRARIQMYVRGAIRARSKQQSKVNTSAASVAKSISRHL